MSYKAGRGSVYTDRPKLHLDGLLVFTTVLNVGSRALDGVEVLSHEKNEYKSPTRNRNIDYFFGFIIQQIVGCAQESRKSVELSLAVTTFLLVADVVWSLPHTRG